MKTMLLEAPGRPLRCADVPVPTPGPGQVLVAVRACGVCRTDLHLVDGELAGAFPYELLWGERTLRSVANLTRRDGEDFLKLAPTIPVRTTTRAYALEAANEALAALRGGRLTGAAVLVPGRQ